MCLFANFASASEEYVRPQIPQIYPTILKSWYRARDMRIIRETAIIYRSSQNALAQLISVKISRSCCICLNYYHSIQTLLTTMLHFIGIFLEVPNLCMCCLLLDILKKKFLYHEVVWIRHIENRLASALR